ncbi:hypothetical protein [Vibrio phage MJW]
MGAEFTREEYNKLGVRIMDLTILANVIELLCEMESKEDERIVEVVTALEEYADVLQSDLNKFTEKFQEVE